MFALLVFDLFSWNDDVGLNLLGCWADVLGTNVWNVFAVSCFDS